MQLQVATQLFIIALAIMSTGQMIPTHSLIGLHQLPFDRGQIFFDRLHTFRTTFVIGILMFQIKLINLARPGLQLLDGVRLDGLTQLFKAFD